MTSDMVKNHSYSERGNPQPPLHWLLFPISSKGFLYAPSQTVTSHWSYKENSCFPQPITIFSENLRSPGICVVLVRFRRLDHDLPLHFECYCTVPIKHRWSVWKRQSALPQLVEISQWHYCVKLTSILALSQEGRKYFI